MSRAPRLCLFGAAADTGNLGVAALGEATLHSLHSLVPDARLLVFDNGRGRRRSPESVAIAHERDGAWISRRMYRPESLWSMRVSGRTRIPANRNITSMRQAAAVLDISGGDSFTDLYGKARWNLVVLPKLIALDLGTPLILLPQTYGPFASTRRRDVAASIVRRARSAWTRDADGLDALRALLGDDFDPTRHREGVDVAFALPRCEPPESSRLEWPTAGVVVGLNVSGLLMNRVVQASKFGVTLDYQHVVMEVARRLLRDVADHLVLVPHVRGGGSESDDRACHTLADELAEPERVSVLPCGLTAGQTKWFISRMDWFCGTRMHATIAALSTGVPSAAIAYSLKTRGVFETCGMEHAVVDARTTGSDEAVEKIMELAVRRHIDRDLLDLRVGEVVHRSSQQFAEILDGLIGRNGEES